MRSVAKSGKSENGQIAVNSAEENSISMRLPTYSYSNVSSGWRFISSFGVERISSCVSGVTSRNGGNFFLPVALSEPTPFNLIFFEAKSITPSTLITLSANKTNRTEKWQLLFFGGPTFTVAHD